MNEGISQLVPMLGLALLHFLWQGAVVGLLAWLALALLRNARPQARYAVACLALLACALLPVYQLLHALAAPDTTASHIVVAATDDGTAMQPWTTFAFAVWRMPSADFMPWIVALWASGAGLLSLRMACGLLWVRRLQAGSHPDANGGWQARIDLLARRFGIRRAVALRMIDDGDSPLSAGLWRPLVLLPAALALRIPADLLEALLAHELAHVRRHDYLVNLLQRVVEVLLFYHPVVWWLSHRIRIERELVADDLAASVLGEPRRLAVALSELDRCTVHSFHLAQAAHGGQVMFRIRQLIRPDRRAIGLAFAMPLVGLTIAAFALYAQAHFVQQPQPRPRPVATVAVATPGVAAAVAHSEPAPAPRQTPAAAPRSAPTPAPRAALRVEDDAKDRVSYALVRKDRDDISMSGDMDDIDEIKAARRGIDGDFLWFRREGQAYVVRDPALMARVQEAWKPLEPLEAQMEVLDERMRPHSDRVEALGERMEALGEAGGETPAMRAASERMEALGEQMETISERQAALSRQLASADDTRQAQLQRELDAIESQQEAIGRQMEEQGRILEAEGRQMEARQRPMEALGREMEEAGKPMEAIGKEMEILGARIERHAKVAEAQTLKLIDEAVGKGLAAPAPGRQ